MGADADLLKDVPLFQFLDDLERLELAEQLDTLSVKAGDTLFKVNDPGDSLYVVRSGEVEIFFKNDTGERIVLEVAGRGDFFGELALFDGGPRSASVIATEDTEVFRLSHSHLEDFIHAQPGAAMAILAAMARRLRVSADRLRHTASRNVNEETEDMRSTVQKAADWIAEFAGSIPFLLLHVVWFTLWLLFNSVHIPGIPQFDPYPFGFLTLTVSLEAIFLSVFVLLSQNRQAAKDRVRSDIEYDVNLKAELEIAHLHEKVDRLTADVLIRLEEMKQGQRKAVDR
jgi:CRP/FNR family transcriptional regulator, cyclic AMP receptor protein